MSEEAQGWKHPNQIAETDWLEARLGDEKLRIFDCSTHIRPVEPGSGLPYLIENAVAEYNEGHIPGAALLDLQNDLSDNSGKLAMALLPPRNWLAGSHNMASIHHHLSSSIVRKP